MLMRFTYLIVILLFAACNQKDKEQQKTSDTITESNSDENGQQDIEKAKTWLVQNIESHFKNFDGVNSDYASITTKEYNAFKTDATSVGMDGALSEAEFKKKWSKRNTEKAGIGEGFLIGGQDFGTIKVTKCEFKNKINDGDYLFETIIEDTSFKSKFYRDIVVKKTNNSFLIDDVVEVKSEYSEQ
jgi:hypothetical protein